MVMQDVYATSATLYVTDRAYVQPRPQSKPALTDFGLQPYVALVCRLMVSNSMIHEIHGSLLIYQPRRDGRLSCPSWMTHSRQFTHRLDTG